MIDVAADTDFNTNPIGTGPFVVEEFQAKSLCRLRANEDYWDGPSPLDTVEIRVISETGTLATALRSGEIDAVIQGATADSVDQLEGDADYGTDICATSRVFLLMLNQNNEHLRNPTFRRALARAIDRGALCNDMLEGSAIPGAGTFPAELPYGDVSITGLEYDLEQARALLAQAGYVLEGERLTRDGEAVTLRIVTSTMRQELQLLAQGVASQLNSWALRRRSSPPRTMCAPCWRRTSLTSAFTAGWRPPRATRTTCSPPATARTATPTTATIPAARWTKCSASWRRSSRRPGATSWPFRSSSR